MENTKENNDEGGQGIGLRTGGFGLFIRADWGF